MKARFQTHVTVDNEGMARNVAQAKTLGLPSIQHPGKWHDHPLAVIGSGPLVADHLDELRDWPGDRWAINYAFVWCRDNGIETTFMTADPIAWDISFLRVADKVLLASCCDPLLFEAARRAEVTIFDIQPGGVVPLSTSASCCATLGPLLGYREIVFFGCESSYCDERTNIVGRQKFEGLMTIRCNGEDFVTTPPLLIQAEAMSAVIRAMPALYRERSGGLLAALVADPDYNVIGWGPGIDLLSIDNPEIVHPMNSDVHAVNNHSVHSMNDTVHAVNNAPA